MYIRGDSVYDGYEVQYNYNPLIIDSNNNGTPDGFEDIDIDGYVNWIEAENNTDPTAVDSPADGPPFIMYISEIEYGPGGGGDEEGGSMLAQVRKALMKKSPGLINIPDIGSLGDGGSATLSFRNIRGGAALARFNLYDITTVEEEFSVSINSDYEVISGSLDNTLSVEFVTLVTASSYIDIKDEPPYEDVDSPYRGADVKGNANEENWEIVSEAVSPVPTDRSRTVIGIGEIINLKITPEFEVKWYCSGDGKLNAGQGEIKKNVELTANKSLSASSATVRAEIGLKTKTKVYTIELPQEIYFSKMFDYPLGIDGPPNNYIGAKTEFEITVTPTTVSFKNVKFHENIPSIYVSWPNNTQTYIGGRIVDWDVGFDNLGTDMVSTGYYSSSKLLSGASYVDFSFGNSFPDEFETDDGDWVPFFNCSYFDLYYSNLEAKVKVYGANNDEGGLQGPYQ
ncbi:hypothetical protein KA977_05435 [Candidatus Dependentiae bacterium]|nr:hypothetical protein [Candidatus Dependentiae bacterium]